MIRFECTRMAQLLQARAGGLSQANALRLEDHLAHCANCSHQAHLLDGLRELSDTAAEPLTQAARQRAVLQAFARVERPEQLPAAKVAWLVPSACGALLAAVLVAVGVARQPLLDRPSDARVLSGAVEHTTHDDETKIVSRTGGVMALAHAKVEFGGQTRARWNGPARVLQLEQGRVVADVDPAKRQTFRVDTRQFRVLVLGTRFEVSQAEVRVTRGRVRVEALNGAELATLQAGESYACTSAPCQPRRLTPRPTAAAVSARQAGEIARQAGSAAGRSDSEGTRAGVEGTRSVADRSPSLPNVREGSPNDREGSPNVREGSPNVRKGSPNDREGSPNNREGSPNVREGSPNDREGSPNNREGSPNVRDGAADPTVARQLELAREALGRRDVAGAREMVAKVLRASLARRDQAEALTLRAECSLVAGDLAGASAGYSLVAQRFSELPAGENALFASARLDSERLSGARAQAGLTRYLARYPHGKFVKEATARLNELRAVHPQP